MDRTLCLTDLPEGARGRVVSLTAQGAMRRRLLELGFVENTTVECVLSGPGGDPRAYLIRGSVIALRRRDSAGIGVERL